MNDLYTAELAVELANRLDGSLLVNFRLDRNRLDLNRISQVTRGAAWFLELIETLLEGILIRHRSAEILFIHGWNVIQARCDIGVGLRLDDPHDVRGQEALLTVSPGYLHGPLGELGDACRRRNIHTTYGERYPGGHPNNLLQLFRSPAVQHTDRWSKPIAEWVRAGRVQAAQLELGVPLRWPGRYRARLLDAVAETFRSPPGQNRRATRISRPVAEPPRPAGFQFYDPAARVGLTARVGVDPSATWVTSRLLLFLDRHRVALFTGEAAIEESSPFGGPRFSTTTDGLRLTFDGPLLEIDDARAYVDLEEALAGSRLTEGAIDLALHETGVAGHGRVCGSILLAGRELSIDTYGFRRSSLLDTPSPPTGSRISLSASFGPDLLLRARSGHGNRPGSVITATPEGESSLSPAAFAVSLEGDFCTPRRFALAAGEWRLLAEPLSQMAIRRPTPGGGSARITLGAARFSRRGFAPGFGFYEYERSFGAAANVPV